MLGMLGAAIFTPHRASGGDAKKLWGVFAVAVCSSPG
jgi:hypothetical protein